MNEEPIFLSNWKIGDWMVSAVALIAGSLAGIISLNISSRLSAILICLAILFGICFPSYFLLYNVFIFNDHVFIKYILRYHSRKCKDIPLSTVAGLQYKYVGGRGSGGDGQVKITYQEGRRYRTLKFSADNYNASKLVQFFEKKNIPVSVDPAWILDKYK